MNTKSQAIQKITSFLLGEKQTLLLTGTHQKKKPLLALALVLSKYPSPAKILFRTNNLKILGETLGLNRVPKTGKPIDVQGGYTLFADTINPTTWRSSPRSIDVAIVYPLDSLKFDAGGKCVQDLVHRRAKKIFIISWTDNKDFSWTDYFNPVHVIYDAEEEDPEYHKRMVRHFSSPQPALDTSKLPDYAVSTPQEKLVKIWCRGRCHKTRWAEMNVPYLGKVALQDSQPRQYTATCLICGYVDSGSSSWSR